MNIRTEIACPPNHWTAVDDDTYDGPGSPIGMGRTKQEATSHLLEQLASAEPIVRRGEIIGERVDKRRRR